MRLAHLGQLSSTLCPPSQSASVSTTLYSSNLSTVTMFVSTSLVIRTNQFSVCVTSHNEISKESYVENERYL